MKEKDEEANKEIIGQNHIKEALAAANKIFYVLENENELSMENIRNMYNVSKYLRNKHLKYTKGNKIGDYFIKK